jgi:hypothetical protein
VKEADEVGFILGLPATSLVLSYGRIYIYIFVLSIVIRKRVLLTNIQYTKINFPSDCFFFQL